MLFLILTKLTKILTYYIFIKLCVYQVIIIWPVISISILEAALVFPHGHISETNYLNLLQG